MKLISKVTSAIVVFCLLISMVVVNVNAETLAAFASSRGIVW